MVLSVLELYSSVGLQISPRGSDILESWTTDDTYALEHAAQFGDGIVLMKRTTELDIFLNIAAFDAATGNAVGVEEEILVRPHPLRFHAKDIIELGED